MRDSLGRWTRGHSGNAAGRPRLLGDVIELARLHTTDAIATLVSVMTDANSPPASRIAAAEGLLSRAWGRPLTAIDVRSTVHEKDPEEMTAIELMAAFDARVKSKNEAMDL